MLDFSRETLRVVPSHVKCVRPASDCARRRAPTRCRDRIFRMGNGRLAREGVRGQGFQTWKPGQPPNRATGAVINEVWCGNRGKCDVNGSASLTLALCAGQSDDEWIGWMVDGSSALPCSDRVSNVDTNGFMPRRPLAGAHIAHPCPCRRRIRAQAAASCPVTVIYLLLPNGPTCRWGPSIDGSECGRPAVPNFRFSMCFGVRCGDLDFSTSSRSSTSSAGHLAVACQCVSL
jgi:hypothetical protein